MIGVKPLAWPRCPKFSLPLLPLGEVWGRLAAFRIVAPGSGPTPLVCIASMFAAAGGVAGDPMTVLASAATAQEGRVVTIPPMPRASACSGRTGVEYEAVDMSSAGLSTMAPGQKSSLGIYTLAERFSPALV